MAAQWAYRQVQSVMDRENANWSQATIDRLAEERTSGQTSVRKLQSLGRQAGQVRSGGDAPQWAQRQVQSIAGRLNVDWTSSQMDRFADQLATGAMTTATLEQMAGARERALEDEALLAEQRMNRQEFLQTRKAMFPWLNDDLMRVFEDAYTEYGQNDVLLLQEIRNGEGREVYDRTFPGNRREDGTLRLSEDQYFSTVAQYRNSLDQRGLNPSAFEARFADLITNEVSADEFEGRIAAVNENIVQQGEEIRRAFAEASGISDFSREATLATVLDPDGVGRELLERRIGVAQIRGAAAESGISRSFGRAEELRQRGVGLQRARQFYGNLSSTVDQFGSISRAARGTSGPSGLDIEAAALLNDDEQARNLSRLLGRERAAFASRRRAIRRNQGGALSGLRER